MAASTPFLQIRASSQPTSQPVGFRHTKLFRPSLGAHDSVASTKLQMREERDCRSRHLDSTFDRSISNVVVTVVQVPDTARENSAADGRGGTRSGETAIHCSRHPGSNGSSTHASACRNPATSFTLDGIERKRDDVSGMSG